MQPFTTFRGTLKRLALDAEAEPARAAAFQWAFPGFLDPVVEQAEPRPASSAPPKVRRRRYSGGLFTASQPLSRGRYSTVCRDGAGDDAWGLCQELRAYAGSTLRQKIFVYDLGSSPYQQAFSERGWLVGQRLGLHFVDPDGEMFARYASIGDGALIGDDGKFWRTHLDYLLEQVEIDNVVDLRLPEAQRWFCDTFREGYGDSWSKPAGRTVARFQDMLSSLMMADLGGSQVTDAIGYALRSMGASALIYPSARCNPETMVVDGELRGWIGFNLVDFRGSAIDAGMRDTALRFDDPEPWDVPLPWPDVRCEVAELTDDVAFAQQWKGSWRLLGVREAHERFWEAGGLLGGREIGDWENQETNLRGDFVRELNRRLRQGKNPSE